MRFSRTLRITSVIILLLFALYEVLLAVLVAPGLSSGIIWIKVTISLHILAAGLFLATSYRQVIRPKPILLTLAISFMVLASFSDLWAFKQAVNNSSIIETKSLVKDTIKNSKMTNTEVQLFEEIFSEPEIRLKQTILQLMIAFMLLSIPLYSNYSRAMSKQSS